MKIALDSNRYTDLRRGVEAVVSLVEGADEVYAPLIVVAELRAGFTHGTRREENERCLTAFLNLPAVFVLPPDEQTTFFYADLYAYLRKKGTPIPPTTSGSRRWSCSTIWCSATATRTSTASPSSHGFD